MFDRGCIPGKSSESCIAFSNENSRDIRSNSSSDAADIWQARSQF